MRSQRTALVYAVHSARLHGTERMALATLEALRDECRPVWIAPAGEATDIARERGYDVFEVRGRRGTTVAFDRTLRGHDRVALIATTVTQSLLFDGLRRLHASRQVAHLHAVHGGADERSAYGNKRLLQPLPVEILAVSDFVRDELVARRIAPGRITVIGNFCEPARLAMLTDIPLQHRPMSQVAVLSRLDPLKRVALLFDALDAAPDLAVLRFDVFGSGSEFETLARRAARHPNVCLHGFRADAAEQLAVADALVHTCDREPYGLAIDEAMLAGRPAIVPARGGAARLIDDRRTGFHYAADDPHALVAALRELRALSPEERVALGGRARAAAQTRACPVAGAARYRAAIDRAFRNQTRAMTPRGAPSRREDRHRVPLDGVPIDALRRNETLLRVAAWLSGDTPRRVATANADFLMRCRHDRELTEALVTADLVTADGFPLVVASRLAGDPLPERVTGADLVEPLVAAAARRGRSVYLLGGADGVAERAIAVLQRRHPQLRVAGHAAPRIDLADVDACGQVAADVFTTGADLLIVALGCPKQELFLARHLATTGARVGIGVGASLDFLVGDVPRAPRWVQRLHMEWLFRALTEPRRLGPRYARNLPFVLGLWWRALRTRRPSTPSPDLRSARS